MKKKSLIYLVIVVVLILLVVYAFVKQSGKPGEYDDFAKCLSSKGVVMYGTDWCPHCKDQKGLFGKSFEYVDYRNCDFNKGECNTAGIKGYPTWVINNERYPGTRSLEELSELSGCGLG